MAAVKIMTSSILWLLLILMVPSPTLAESSGVLANSWNPLIMSESDSIVVDDGGTLNLTCRDREKVVWVAIQDKLQYKIYEETYDEGNERPYIANLVIENVSYKNVGYYYCVHNTTENKDKAHWSPTDPNVSSIYIYVKDLNNLLVKEAGSVMFNAVVNQNFTFPCKPTFPEVNVTLEKIQGTFDPREGFTVVITGDEDMLICRARYSNLVAEKDFIIRHVQHTRKEKLKKPMVDVSNYWQKDEIREQEDDMKHYDIVEGSSVNLTCTYDHDSTTDRSLHWDVEGPAPKNKSGNHLIHRKTVNNKDMTRIFEITNADPATDSTEYSCYVKNGMNSESDPTTIVINVLPLSDKIIKLVPEELDDDLTQDDHQITWRILYSAYPEPTFIWWKGDEILANSSNPRQGSKRYKLELKIRDDGHMFLVIDSPTLNDIGVYTVEGLIMEKGKIMINHKVQLNFTMPVTPSQPIIEFQGNNSEGMKTLISQHQDFKLVCKSHGYPKPNLNLEFSKCYNKDNCTDFEVLSTDNEENANSLRRTILDQTENNPVNRTTVWEGIARAQGIYRCSAENAHNTSQSETKFLINDGRHDHLSIEVTVNGKSEEVAPFKVLEADNVTVLCKGNKFSTNPPLTWRLNDHPMSNNSVSKKHRLTRTLADTDFSYVSILRFDKISLEEMPLKFNCEDAEASYLIPALELHIEPMRAPKWSTQGKPLQDYNLKEMGNLSLNCPATGAPEPEIKWYKDDELLRDTDEVNKKHRIIKGSTITFGYLKISDSGVYKCEATNRNGTIYSEATISITDPDAFANINIIIIVGVLSSILIVVSIFLCRKIYKDRKREYNIRLEDQRMFEEGNPENINPELGLDEQAELLPYDTKYEVTRDSIIFDKLLGAGAFGRVYRATALNLIPGHARTTVAVKMMKSRTDSAQLKALRSEVKIMIHIGRHVNIVNLLGACSKELASKGELLLLVEYCRYGNILDYMRLHRKDFINQINEHDKIDPSITDARLRHRSESGSRSRMSRNLKYAHLSFNQEMVTYTPGQVQSGEPPENTLWVEPSSPTESNGTNGPIPESFRTRTLSGSSAVHVTSDMSTMTFESSTGASDGYLGSRIVGPNPVTLCSKELLCWAFQIARGMEYLAFKKVLHGDLAARNILLTEDNIVKISDFGLAKDIYKDANYRKKSKTPLPWKWLAPECFRDSVFSTQSDIWSFGVVLWEIFSLGQSPYPGIDYDESFLARLDKGIRPEQPKYATHDLYRVMMDCWCNEPVERPSFSELEGILGMMLGDAEKQHYLELNTPYQLENTTSTFVNFIQSPDYMAKVREMTPTLDEDGYEMPFSPSPFTAVSIPLGHESHRSPRVTPLQMDYMQKDRTDGVIPEDGAGCYVHMSSPTSTITNVFNFDKDVVDSIAKRDSEIQLDTNDTNDNVIIREENYLSMQNSPISIQNSPNLDKSPNSWQNGVNIPLRHKLLRTASQIGKHDSGLYSPTANMQNNPQYMIMDTFPKTDESNYLTKDNVHDMYNGKNHNYINLDYDNLPCKSFQKNYIKDAMCIEEYTNLLPNGNCRGRTISETSSGLGSIYEESPPENRIKTDSLMSSAMESVLEEPVCA